VEPTLTASETKKWWAYAWGEPKPGGTFGTSLGDARVLLCHYRSPSDSGARSPRRLIPVWKIGNVRLDKFPRRISEFDAAKRQAD
jgi:hypothetical protein